MPVGVKVSMVSVTTEARPWRMARKRSPSGTKQTRWSHGSYAGRKWRSTSYPSGSWAVVCLRMKSRTFSGRRRLNW